jgi:DNA-binding transcriptional MerR regulator
MKIGEMAIKFGLSIDILRFYNWIGLLKPNRKNGVREYSIEDCNRLEMILILRNLYFTLDEIKKIIQIDSEIDQSILENELDSEKNQLALILNHKYKQLEQKQKTIFLIWCKKINKQTFPKKQSDCHCLGTPEQRSIGSINRTH